MEYGYFKLEPEEGNWANLYPLVCWHLGTPESDDDFIREHVQRIANDPNGWWFYMGDMGDCVTRHSKGDPFSQFLSPEEQIEYGVELLEPIRGRGLFGVAGNHGDRVYRETGKSFDRDLCHRLGIPYKGVAGFFHLDVHRTCYEVYVRHGLNSGRTIASKVNSAMRAGEDIIADAVITAHSHVAMELEPRAVRMLKGCVREGTRSRTGKIYTRFVHQYVCGSAYDSRSGYAEGKGYAPILPAHVCVSFHGMREGNRSRKGNRRGSGWEQETGRVHGRNDPHQQKFETFRANPASTPASERWRKRLGKPLTKPEWGI